MKEIILTFKTEKGEQAYKKVDEEGKKQSFMDRKISKAVASDKVVSKNPLIVNISIKVQRLAVHVELDKKVKEALEKFGAVEGVDYSMKVVS